MSTALEHFGMSRSFNSTVGLEFASSTMELPYEAAENYSEMDSMYPNPMAVQYCQPYLDHSYASQLPTAAAAPDLTAMSVPETLASYIDIEDVSCHTTVVTAPMGGKNVDDSFSDPWEGSVTRCICDFQHDDGYMICCDRCGVWQHVDCMGVDRNNIPESYLCELCSPRLVDKRRAIRLQTLKKEQLDMEASATDSSAEERYGSGKRGGRRPGMGRKRRDSQSTVPQNKRVRRRTTSEPADDKSAELRKDAQQASMQNHKPVTTKRTRRSTMDSQRNVTIDHSREDFCRNTYSSGVLLLMSTLKQTDAASGSLSAHNPSLLKDQISKQRYRIAQCEPGCKGIETTEVIRAGQAIAEYTGHVMLLDEYQPDKQLNMAMPFLLHYEGTESLRFNFCIDSSSLGNDIRFIRCSCTPNAKVLHIIEQNAIRFFICATKSIAEGREVTIPLSYDYTKSSSEVKCACARAACPIARFFRSKSMSRPVRIGRGRKSSISEEERSKADVLSAAATASLAAGGTDRVGVPSGIKQRRRSSLRTELQQDQPISQDVGADVHLINKLTAAVHQPDLSVALTSNYTSEPCAVSSSEMSWRNHEGLMTDSQLNQPLSSIDLDDAEEAGSLVIALGDDATPSRKTREQKKIEAVEKTFEKIEKVNVRGKETPPRAKANKNKTQNEKINNEEKAKKTPNNKNKTLPNNESIFQSESNGGGRTSMRAKKPRGKPQTV